MLVVLPRFDVINYFPLCCDNFMENVNTDILCFILNLYGVSFENIMNTRSINTFLFKRFINFHKF